MQRVMWEMNVRGRPFTDRIQATVSGGFDLLSLSFREYRKEAQAGNSPESLATTALEQGVRLDFLDGISSWTPVRSTPDAPDFMRQAFDFSAEDALELCRRASLTRIVAVAGFDRGSLSVAQIVSHFGAFCDKAADQGIWVDLEAMPVFGGLRTLADAWTIVADAGRANCGVMFDTWHFQRDGADYAVLKSIPRGKIVNVQLVDGSKVPHGSDLWTDAFHHRELPGWGEFPLSELLQILAKTQDLQTIGPEAICDRLDRFHASEVGRQADESMKRAGFSASAD